MVNILVSRISPDDAKRMLSTSIGNRALSYKMVELYAEEMKKGLWVLNGTTISFDEEGHLMDGHHRLNAVIKSGVTIESSIAYGVKRSTFSTIDVGKKRTCGDFLSAKQYPYFNVIASGFMFYCGIKQEIKTTKPTYTHLKISQFEVVSRIEENKDKWIQVGRFAAGKSNDMTEIGRLMPIRFVAGIYYYLVTEINVPQSIVEGFFDDVISLDSSANGHIELLRKSLIKNCTSKAKLSENCIYNMIVKTWNNFINDNSVPKRLSWAESGDTREPWQIFSKRSVFPTK